MKLIPQNECVKGRIYKLRSRNLRFGVYDGEGGFVGIRVKWGSRYLFTEFHWDAHPDFGTVKEMKDLGVDVPTNIVVADSLGFTDYMSDRDIYFNDEADAWFYVDTQKMCEDPKACRKPNKDLFQLLERITDEYTREKRDDHATD